MFGKIDTMRMARELGAHAAARQRVIATNVANADTPGYRAADLAAFAPEPPGALSVGLRTTRPGHVGAGNWGSGGSGVRAARIDAGGEASPDGNTVSLEDEMMRAAETKRQFDLSLAVVQSGMTLLRTAAGRRG